MDASFNPHPPLSGFPFVLLSLVVIAELVSIFRKDSNGRGFSRNLLYILCLFAPMTYFSGYWGAELSSQSFVISQDLISTHQGWAQLFLLSLVPCLVLSLLESHSEKVNLVLRYGFRVALLVCYALVILTSFQGGQLVFTHGAGVSASK